MRVMGILLLDSFRMLRARRLFWVALCLSGLIAMVYASIGFDEGGVSVLFGLLSFESELPVSYTHLTLPTKRIV